MVREHAEAGAVAANAIGVLWAVWSGRSGSVRSGCVQRMCVTTTAALELESLTVQRVHGPSRERGVGMRWTRFLGVHTKCEQAWMHRRRA